MERDVIPDKQHCNNVAATQKSKKKKKKIDRGDSEVKNEPAERETRSPVVNGDYKKQCKEGL